MLRPFVGKSQPRRPRLSARALVKAGTKALTQEQTNLKTLVLSVINRISDDSDSGHPMRLGARRSG